jgi:hypothetical protein
MRVNRGADFSFKNINTGFGNRFCIRNPKNFIQFCKTYSNNNFFIIEILTGIRFFSVLRTFTPIGEFILFFKQKE